MYKLFYKWLIALSTFACLVACTTAYEKEDGAWQAFREGKAVAVMRHAFAPFDVDNSVLTHDVCQGERNLSQQGRDQAVYIGETIRAKGVTNAKVYASPVCRCFDTATLLAFGDATIMPAINSFYLDENEGAKGHKQTAELTEWIKQAVQQQNTSNILVTHGFNISTMTGDFVSEGDFLLIGLEDDELVTLDIISAQEL